MVRGRWRKLCGRWAGVVWVDECFFWYQLTQVDPEYGCVCVCACARACVCVAWHGPSRRWMYCTSYIYVCVGLYLSLCICLWQGFHWPQKSGNWFGHRKSGKSPGILLVVRKIVYFVRVFAAVTSFVTFFNPRSIVAHFVKSTLRRGRLKYHCHSCCMWIYHRIILLGLGTISEKFQIWSGKSWGISFLR